MGASSDKAAHILKQCPTCLRIYDKSSSFNFCPADRGKLRSEVIIAEKYVVTALLGAGGMGTVWRAVDRATGGRVVALKLLEPTKDVLMRFEREVKAVAQIDSDHVVRIYDSGKLIGDRYYLIMECLEGETLRDRLNRSPEKRLPQAEALDIWLQAAKGVAAAHHKGIGHRDLKPENLFLARLGPEEERQERLKILDFGVAILHNDHREGNTVAVGTPGYTAPEQWSGAPSLASDVYSLGVILFEMLTGGLPPLFGGPEEMLERIALRMAMSAELKALASDVLAPRPDDRPANAIALRKRIRALPETEERRKTGKAPFHAQTTDAASAVIFEAFEPPPLARDTVVVDSRAEVPFLEDSLAKEAAPDLSSSTPQPISPEADITDKQAHPDLLSRNSLPVHFEASAVAKTPELATVVLHKKADLPPSVRQAAFGAKDEHTTSLAGEYLRTTALLHRVWSGFTFQRFTQGAFGRQSRLLGSLSVLILVIGIGAILSVYLAQRRTQVLSVPPPQVLSAQPVAKKESDSDPVNSALPAEESNISTTSDLSAVSDAAISDLQNADLQNPDLQNKRPSESLPLLKSPLVMKRPALVVKPAPLHICFTLSKRGHPLSDVQIVCANKTVNANTSEDRNYLFEIDKLMPGDICTFTYKDKLLHTYPYEELRSYCQGRSQQCDVPLSSHS